MKTGALLILLLLAGCDVTHEGDKYLWDTDTGLDTGEDIVEDPDCYNTGWACTANTITECWEDGGKEYLRMWGIGCGCFEGEQVELYRDMRCLYGCTVNPSGQDFCNPNPDEGE